MPESPRPNSVNARPEATWLATKISVTTAKSAAMIMPATIAGEHAERRIAGIEGDREGGDRPHRHHAFHAEIEDAGALRHQLAERRDQERRRRRDDGQQDAFDHVLRPPRALQPPRAEYAGDIG